MKHTQAVKESLLALAMITGKELNAIALNAYVEALSDLDEGSVLLVLKDWLRTSRGFPFPADIRAKVAPVMSEEDGAREVAVIIKRTVGRRGNYWPMGTIVNGTPVFESKEGQFNTWEEAARSEMGTLAYEVVRSFGGWTAICDFSEATEPGTFQAQIREIAKTLSKKALSGDLEALPELPAPASQMRAIVNTAFKQIEGDSDA